MTTGIYGPARPDQASLIDPGPAELSGPGILSSLRLSLLSKADLTRLDPFNPPPPPPSIPHLLPRPLYLHSFSHTNPTAIPPSAPPPPPPTPSDPPFSIQFSWQTSQRSGHSEGSRDKQVFLPISVGVNSTPPPYLLGLSSVRLPYGHRLLNRQSDMVIF